MFPCALHDGRENCRSLGFARDDKGKGDAFLEGGCYTEGVFHLPLLMTQCRTYGARILLGIDSPALPPDFLWNLVASANFMRLSLRKGARAALSGAAWQEIRVRAGLTFAVGPPGLASVAIAGVISLSSCRRQFSCSG